MMEWISVALSWAADTGAPNAVLVVALLTDPSTWTKRIIAAVNNRIGGGDA